MLMHLPYEYLYFYISLHTSLLYSCMNDDTTASKMEFIECSTTKLHAVVNAYH